MYRRFKAPALLDDLREGGTALVFAMQG